MTYAKNGRIYPGLRVLVMDGPSRQILPILKDLRGMRCEITAFTFSKLDNGYVSRYPDHRILVVPGQDAYQVLLNAVKTGKYDVLLPLTDWSMDLITLHLDELSQYVRIPAPSREVFMRAYNKQKTMEICMDHNIPCTITKREDEDLKEFVARVGYPIVAKPRMANGSRGLKIIHNEEKLDELIGNGTIVLSEYVIQEFVPQTGRQLNIHLFMDDERKICANLVTEKSRWYPVDGGASCLCRTMFDEKAAADCQRLLEAVEWRSYCEIEMIVDPRDGVAKVMEINGRASASIKIMQLAGINVARQMLTLALGEAVDRYGRAKDDIRLRCIMTDALWLLKAPDRFTRKPFWFSPVRTHDALFTFADPLPFFAYAAKKVPEYRTEMNKRKRD